MTAIFPGSFDPATLGHADIIKRASAMFDRLIVAVLDNANKKTTFSAGERVGFLKKIADGFENTEIRAYSGLLTDFFVLSGGDVIIRGLRGAADFEHEFGYALAFKKVNAKAETLFIPSAPEHIFISSGMAKEAARFGEGKNSWLTGAAAWAYVNVSQYLLGIRPELDGLRITPCLPEEFEELTVTRLFRSVKYDIKIRRTGTRSMTVNGVPSDGCLVPVSEKDCAVEVTF